MTIWTTGLLTGLALIVAIGSQNAFVLRQGVRREHVGVVVVICALSDLVLIAAGTLGIGVLVDRLPWLITVMRVIGVVYLLWFAFTSFRSAFRPQALEEAAPRGRSSVVLTTLALTWLNPHVYLDTVLSLGNLANLNGADGRWLFATGAMCASLLWFTALGFGAHSLSRVLRTPRTWQIVDVVVGVLMVLIAAKLAFGG